MRSILAMNHKKSGYAAFWEIVKGAFGDKNGKKVRPKNKVIAVLILDSKMAAQCMERAANAYATYLEVAMERGEYSLRSVIEVVPSYPTPPPMVFIFMGKKGVNEGHFVNDNLSMASTVNTDFEYVNDENRN